MTFFLLFVKIFKSFQNARAISSAGRAGALQALGRRFDPVIAQSLLLSDMIKIQIWVEFSLYDYFKIYLHNRSDSFSIRFFKFYNKIYFKKVNGVRFNNRGNNFTNSFNFSNIHESYRKYFRKNKSFCERK